MNDRSTKPPVATGNDDRVLFGKKVKSVSGRTNLMLRWRDGTVPTLKNYRYQGTGDYYDIQCGRLISKIEYYMKYESKKE
ncbi:hypothetical protein OHD16_15425 [Sphingobacterium sp. ML3W]|uniref:hypothetical protein n=1 Tax=Sphingobacterium sp. ML3W TaxID=1538644 RepID=UPI00300864D7